MHQFPIFNTQFSICNRFGGLGTELRGFWDPGFRNSLDFGLLLANG
jgi:hypothetical protein